MTRNEWERCTDVRVMLEFLWTQEPYINLREKFAEFPPEASYCDWLEYEVPINRFYLASCRNIWDLLPQKASRRGIELAENFVSEKVPWEQVSVYNWHTEGAAFLIEYNTNQAKIDGWCSVVESIPKDKMRSMVSSERMIVTLDARDLLLRAAYFADYAMMYSSLNPKGPPIKHTEFMFADTLRKYISYPEAL